MRKVFLLMLAFSLTLPQASGQKANYELARRMLDPHVFSTEVKPNFLPGSDKFWYSYKTAEATRYYFVDPKKKEQRDLFDNAAFAAGIHELTGLNLDPVNIGIPYMEFTADERSLILFLDKYKLTYDFYAHEFTGCETLDMSRMQQPQPDRNLSPDGKYEIFARNHNLFVREVASGAERQLTKDGEIFHSYAVVEHDTHTDTDIPTRAVWLGGSERVYFARSDSRSIEDMYLLNSLTPRPSSVRYKYMIPGDRNVTQYSAGVIDVATGERINIQTDKWKDQTIDVIYASPNGDFLYMLRKNRPGNRMDFCKADTRTGDVRVLFEETVEPYLNDQLFQFSILNGGKDIIWFSERTGWGNLYHYNGEGRMLNKITDGRWTSGKILRVDTTRREIYFEGYGYDKNLNPYYKQLFKASLDKGNVKLLTPEDANHKVIVTPGEGYLVDSYSRVDARPVSVLRDKNGKVIVELARADLSKWTAAGWMLPEKFVVMAADDSTELHGVMWKPADFDPSRKYPVLTHVYPGPQTENIPLDFSPTGGYDGPLAQLGFVVVMFGNRGGSPLRGLEYHTYGYGNLRDYAIEDNKYGLEQLADRHPFMDLGRVGIFGNSGGGMMTFAAMCTYPDFYKAGVSASGNHDNRIFNKWWSETHHGVEQFYGAFRAADGSVFRDTVFRSQPPTNLALANRLQGHLMLATGDMDDNVHPSQTYRLVDALIKTGKNFDFVLLPGNRHDFVNQSLPYFQYKMWFHFSRYLLGDSSADWLINLSGVGIDKE